MNEVWKAYGNGGNLQCTAKEVHTEATYVEGPVTCERGTMIKVNVTASIHFHATRYDFAIYTYTGTLNMDPVFGESCAVDILDEEHAIVFDEDGNGVYDLDGDSCWDVVAQAGWTMANFSFQENLEVPCEFGDDDEQQTVHIQNCISWRTHGQNNHKNENLNCDEYSAYPGSPSKCDCSFMDIGIKISGDPSSSPSSHPTDVATYPPTHAPTYAPTSSPSKKPTRTPTSSPSRRPTLSPTLSPVLLILVRLPFSHSPNNFCLKILSHSFAPFPLIRTKI